MDTNSNLARTDAAKAATSQGSLFNSDPAARGIPDPPVIRPKRQAKAANQMSEATEPAAPKKGEPKKGGQIDPAEWLLHLPKAYIDFQPEDLPFGPGDSFCGEVTVLSHPRKKVGARRPMWQFEVATRTIELRVTYFGNKPEHTTDWKDVRPGARIVLKGEVNQWGRTFTLDKAERVPIEMFGRIAPKYDRGALKRASSATVTHHVAKALSDDTIMRRGAELLHERLLAASPGVDALEQILRDIHAPDDEETGKRAVERCRRLAALSILKGRPPPAVEAPEAAVAIPDHHTRKAIERVESIKGFTLSESQYAAIEGLVASLKRPRPTQALISGDVGSGKTIPYLVLAVLAYTAGARVAVMIPNGVLAKQVFDECQEMFPKVAATFVGKGGLKGKGENEAGQGGENGILIGTTAIAAYAKRSGWRADVLFLDEQQKLGLEQKKQLLHDHSNVIEATATCIPMTMGLIKHGDMEIYRLAQHAEKDIRSHVLGDERRSDLFAHVRSQLEAGKRCAVIYPIRDDDENPKRSVAHAAEAWENAFPGKVACLHGQMKFEEKANILGGVKDKTTPLLIASSIIEVGITIPDLATLIVVDAGRYGTSTLHQMRGRLVRQGGIGHFFMLPGLSLDDPDALTGGQVSTLERLSLLLKTQDGFELAELDMRNRGFGDLFREDADKQHGGTRAVFHGLKLTPEYFDEIAQTLDST